MPGKFKYYNTLVVNVSRIISAKHCCNSRKLLENHDKHLPVGHLDSFGESPQGTVS